MNAYHLLTILILLTTAFTFLNHKYVKWPATIAVTVFSLIISLLVLLIESYIPGLKAAITVSLEKVDFQTIVMNVVLGFLLFGAAFKMDVKLFKQHLKPILGMAVFSTVISTFIVGILMYYLFALFKMSIPLLDCLLFGALISPTDPIAALGVLQRLGISKKLEFQITGESLINDGIAIVVFTTLLNIDESERTGVILTHAIVLFLSEAGGAILFGALLGWLALQLLKAVDNYKVEILITLCVVMGGYTLASVLHVSSAIAMVVAGLICSTEGKKEKSYISNDDVFTFWDLVEDLMNVILFLLIGIGVFVIPINMLIFLLGFVSIFLILIARFLSLIPVYALLKKNFEKNSLPILTWAGLRGAVCIALSLSLPEVNHRSEFLAITYIIAVFSIVVQGLTIKKLALKSGLVP
jgi:monovalent cation:H+ antiporter, CPA1 family